MIKKIQGWIMRLFGCDSGWTDCNEKLPIDNQIVLAFNIVSGVNQAIYKESTGTNGFTLLVWGDRQGKWFPSISHWMPRPQPPEADK